MLGVEIMVRIIVFWTVVILIQAAWRHASARPASLIGCLHNCVKLDTSWENTGNSEDSDLIQNKSILCLAPGRILNWVYYSAAFPFWLLAVCNQDTWDGLKFEWDKGQSENNMEGPCPWCIKQHEEKSLNCNSSANLWMHAVRLNPGKDKESDFVTDWDC